MKIFVSSGQFGFCFVFFCLVLSVCVCFIQSFGNICIYIVLTVLLPILKHGKTEYNFFRAISLMYNEHLKRNVIEHICFKKTNIEVI